MKLDRLASLIAAIAVVSTVSLISFRRSQSITTAVLIATFLALAVPIIWSTATSRGAYKKAIGFAGISVYFGEAFLAEMMSKPGIHAIIRWGILFVLYGVSAFLWSREKPAVPAAGRDANEISIKSFEPISKPHVPASRQ